jgi:uncharacterized protein
MRWRVSRRSENVEDFRGRGSGRTGMKIGGLGLVILLVIGFFTGINPLQLLEGLESLPTTTQVQPSSGEAQGLNDEQRDFVAAVLGDTEDTWQQLFSASGKDYVPPKLVLYEGAIQSACGMGAAAMGPFYCPGDTRVYLDLGFFRELDQRFGAPGDFAQAYVIAHEIGHHIQNLLGISAKVHRARQQLSEAEANALSVRLELQADCLAGVWAHHAHRERQLLESGDVEEGLQAAAAVGDDTLQRRSQGHVVPESWTHGSAGQRSRWFRRGLSSGEVAQCDTFQAASL